jgi:hypothetical protein
MVGLRSPHRGSVRKPEGKRQLGRTRRRWDVILKGIINSVKRACTAFIWLRIGTNGGLLWTQ